MFQGSIEWDARRVQSMRAILRLFGSQFMKLTGQQDAERCAEEAEAVVGEDIDQAGPDAAVLPEVDALDGEGGKRGEGAEEADEQQEPQLG